MPRSAVPGGTEGYLVWPSESAVPEWFRDRRIPHSRYIDVVDARESEDPFLAGFFWATSAAYEFLFWPILDQSLYDEAVFMIEEPETL